MWTLQKREKYAEKCSLLCIVHIIVVPLQPKRERETSPTPPREGLNRVDMVWQKNKMRGDSPSERGLNRVDML